MKKKIMVFCILVFLLFTVTSKISAKYTISSNSVEIIKINKVDTVKPMINGRNIDIYDEVFQREVTVTYFDEFGISSAKYWFHPTSKDFSRRAEQISPVELYFRKMVGIKSL